MVDAVTGEVLYRRNLTSSGAPTVSTATAQAWPFYPSDIPPNGGGDLAPVTFPVFDTNPVTSGPTELFGPAAWVFTDVRDDSTPDPEDAVAPTSGLDFDYSAPLSTTPAQQNCSTARQCTWDKDVAKELEGQPESRRGSGVLVPEPVPRPPRGRSIGFNDAAGNFEFGGAGGDDPVLGNTSDGANTDHGFPDNGPHRQREHDDVPDGEPPTMQMYLFRKAPKLDLPTVPSANGAMTPRWSTTSTRMACPAVWSCTRMGSAHSIRSSRHRWARRGATGTPKTS